MIEAKTMYRVVCDACSAHKAFVHTDMLDLALGELNRKGWRIIVRRDRLMIDTICPDCVAKGRANV